MVVSAAITADFCLSAALFFGMTVFIAFVTDHGPVLVFVHSCIRWFSGNINFVSGILKISSTAVVFVFRGLIKLD